MLCKLVQSWRKSMMLLVLRGLKHVRYSCILGFLTALYFCLVLVGHCLAQEYFVGFATVGEQKQSRG